MLAEEYADWLIYYQYEPFGFAEERKRAGTIAAYIGNHAGKVRRDYLKSEDILPTKYRKPLMSEAEKVLKSFQAMQR